MVEDRKPKFAVIPGGLEPKGLKSKARQAHRDIAAKCILDIHEIRDRMAKRVADPELFNEEFKKYFNTPTTTSDLERRRQMEVALEKWLKFEEDFYAHLNANGYRSILLPAEKIAATVKHIADTAWVGFRPVFHGRKPTPPDSA
ncbi:MAG: hypothetical protein WC350_02470 [Candidatus Micrarchaeia archaeon]|jgi:hypothetical protein